MGISPEDDPVARPMPPDPTDQMLEDGANLASRWRLARAQEHHHRFTALDMVDVDGQEAAGVVMGVEQRQLLVAVDRITGIVDVQGALSN